VGWDLVHLELRPLLAYCTSPGRSMIIMEQLLEWGLAGETEVLGENLPQCHFVHHKAHRSHVTLHTLSLFFGKANSTVPLAHTYAIVARLDVIKCYTLICSWPPFLPHISRSRPSGMVRFKINSKKITSLDIWWGSLYVESTYPKASIYIEQSREWRQISINYHKSAIQQ
jgi:hypothetical protein